MKTKKFLAILMVMLMAALTLGGAALAEQEKKDVPATAITVTGKATVRIAPDMAIVQLGVRETDKEVLAAQTSVNAKVNAVVEALIENKVSSEDISTSYISIYADYRYDPQTGEQIFTGYTAENQLSIKVRAIDKVGALIDAAIAAGANQLSNLTFTRENNTEAVDKALALAVEDAARKAGVIAKASGVKLGGVIKAIEEPTYYYYGEGELNRMVAPADSAGGETEAQAGLLDVSMTVTMTYEITK